jgi:anti-sigma regulatory factor (Ser/Thr protein kinase)
MSTDRIVLPRHAAAARAARQFLSGVCAGLAGADELADAQLLVSELVTNAVRYGRPPIEVRVRCDPGQGVHVWVRDGGPGRPLLREPGVDDDGGRGLPLVKALSSAWGVQPLPTGKQVWFRLAPDRPAASTARPARSSAD